MKKLLIITYYWPPSGGSGVQRWLYFVKYLRLFGWEPIVYTVENGEYPFLDEGLAKHIPEDVVIIRQAIKEPYEIYRLLSGQKEKVNPTIFADSSKKNLIKKLFLWIRGNLFIPDPRIFWLKPSVKFLKQYLIDHPVDAVVSTGPPHSMHMIARNLKRELNIPWLADFRDPWTQIYFFDQLHMTSLAKFIHRKLEKSVLAEADKIITVSHHCKLGLEEISKRSVNVITNGYETFDISKHKVTDNKIRMLYAGVLSLDRNPTEFWISLEKYLESHPEINTRFELWLIGNIDLSIIRNLRNTKLIRVLNVLPSITHQELQKHLINADILLLIGVKNHPGVITGKFFEYLFIKKPIFSISPEDSDLVHILNETKSGCNADFSNSKKLLENLNWIIETHENKSFDPISGVIEKYSRKNLTGNLVSILDKMV